MSNVGISILRSVPPSNMNRGENGAPKMTVFGGITRSRNSPQAKRYAIREDFLKDGIRTREFIP